MYSRLPPTYELLEALEAPSAPTPPSASPPAGGLARLLWIGFIVALVATLLGGGALAVWRLWLKHPVPPWSLRAFEAFLATAAACYVGAGLARTRSVLARLRNPLRWQAREMDRQRAAEDALLRQLARIPPAQLEARQRRVALQLRLWEGAARTVGLLLALAPAAVVLASAWRALPRPEQMVPMLLWGYGVMLVAGGASYLYLHVQCSRPLRRLAYVLGEAARMNAELDARRAQRAAVRQEA
ncbi:MULTISPECIES: hypothetical protein [unclassified Cupriavidus]|uniref:hypothetical protein n=1 Tax=unclassified Cupriavidus TaxID=2640874 RepID=UPI001AE14B42|nr:MULTISPECIES: hypothetical protein [unclassified Cupriavidus]MBP0631961.1 hypothetical protein [Cupriavidus sp. AcVe19-1a]MBP0635953.1 hypothetical protein [Cupriavidus sp. AcVe19-6a]